jgi:hypothetical protein
MNTEKNNKLISEFLNDKIIIEDTEYIISRDLPNMKFDSSWDWIIPVIKKIRNITNAKLSIDLFDTYRNMNLMLSPFHFNIKEVNEAVIEFIEWYNKQEI